MPVLDNIVATIGRTPLVRLTRVIRSHATVLAKMESHNPLGSVKDRVGAAMIDAAWRDGRLNSESIIVEPTSGNTGISLAFVAAGKGLRCIIVMPESMSMERRKVLHALGAELVLTDAQAGMSGAIARAMEMAGGRVEGGNGAAAILGMNPGTLRHRMRKLGIPFGKTAKTGYGKPE